jgi:hypothetical protein
LYNPEASLEDGYQTQTATAYLLGGNMANQSPAKCAADKRERERVVIYVMVDIVVQIVKERVRGTF